MSKRIDLSYRRYRIIAAERKSIPTAVVYDGDTRAVESAGATLEAAVDEAKSWVDQRIGAQRASRRLAHVGTADEYRRAFQALSIGRHQAAMLRAHANAADCTLTATELAQAAGYESYEAANAHYGRLGRQVAEFLDVVPPIDRQRGEPVWTRVLAHDADEEDEHGHWQWVMHPEVAEALRAMNMA